MRAGCLPCSRSHQPIYAGQRPTTQIVAGFSRGSLFGCDSDSRMHGRVGLPTGSRRPSVQPKSVYLQIDHSRLVGWGSPGRHGRGDRAFARGCRALAFPAGERRADEGKEERMRGQRLGLEFGMELAAEEPGMLRRFDDLDVLAVGRAAGDAESGIGERLFVLAVELVAVAVALGNLRCA